MLWNIVYEFFIKYIFGGYYGGNFYDTHISAFSSEEGFTDFIGIDYFKAISFVSLEDENITYSLGLGNYLSLIATIISMVAIVLICCALIKKIYNMCAHIIG